MNRIVNLKEEYQKALDELLQEPTSWDAYDELEMPGLDWRLWDSIKDLDFAWSFVKDLIKMAKKKRKYNKYSQLGEIFKLIDEAIGFLDPEHWKGSHKLLMNVTTESANLQKALVKLEKANKIYMASYLDISIDIETQRSKSWVMVTPIIAKHLRFAIHGLKEYLKASSNTAN